MTLRWFAPLVLVAVVVGAYLGGKRNARIADGLDRLAQALFGRFVTPHPARERRIEATFVEQPYRTYAARSYLFAALGLLAGAVAGAYAVAGVLAVADSVVRALAALPRTMTAPLGIHPAWELELSTRGWWLLVLGGGAVSGVLTGTLAYALRWQLPSSAAEVRRRAIDEGLPRTTAFMYALSRGGMEFPAVLETLAANRRVYGEPARELTVASREMTLFGQDLITALRRMARRTPSDQFRTFSENLASVLQSGRDLPGFLEEQYERFREETDRRQEDVLTVLATIAEGYVTVLVAGVLFLLTILLVFGLTTTETLWLLQLLVYLLIPLANAAFAVFLMRRLDRLGVARRDGTGMLAAVETATPLPPAATEPRRTDGGVSIPGERAHENGRTLALYDRIGRVKAAVGSPFQLVRSEPTRLLWIAVPVAVALFVVRAPAAFRGTGIAVSVLDDLLVQSVLVVLGTYAVARELHTRRIDRIEAATPELIERLASLNEAGMSVVESFRRLRGSDVGVLTPEVERINRDLDYGGTVDDALVRFGRRVHTAAVSRAVALLTHGMRASGQVGPVLRIAAEQARAEVALRRKRRRRMFTYLVVIYVSFFVFLVIIVAVTEVLVPSLPDHVPLADDAAVGPSPGVFSRFGDVDQAAYTLVFFHAVMIQAVCAGFIAGQLGEGSLRDGAKHAAIMLAIAYLVFALLASPVAAVSALDTTSDGEAVFVDSASLSEGGFVAVYEGEDLAADDVELLGHTEYLPPGTHENIWVPLLDGEIDDDRTVLLVAHEDTTGTETFEFQPPYRGGDQPDRPYESLSQRGTPGVTVEVTYIGEIDRE